MELRRLTTRTGFTNYIPLPRSILELDLSSTAIVLYGVLLGRATLSQKNDYTDDSGWVYVVYPIEELAHLMRLSNTTIKDSLRRLERAGLVRRVRPSRKEANRLFLCLPADGVKDTRTAGFPSRDSRKSGPDRAGKPAPSNLSKLKEIENRYQHSQEESF